MSARGDAAGASQSVPTHDDVVAQLARICASSDFDAPERAKNFLRYVVNETLAGRGHRIKAFTVAVEVFTRDETFDALNDPVVRIEAARLRRALERYYLLAGHDDRVIIEIPKGAYVPTFAVRPKAMEDQSSPDVPVPTAGSAASAPGAALPWWRTTWWRMPVLALLAIAVVIGGISVLAALWLAAANPCRGDCAPSVPTLAVLPFEDLGDGPEVKTYSLGIADAIVTQLARFKEISVYGFESSRSIAASDGLEPIRKLGARYTLEGGIRMSTDRVIVTARLTDVDKKTIVWSGEYDDAVSSADLFTVQQDVAAKVVTALAPPYAAIFQSDTDKEHAAHSEDLDAHLCMLRFYAYRAELSQDFHARERDCLEQAVKRSPDSATAWAMLSIIYLDEDRFRFNPRTDSSARARALDSAQQAVRLAPDNGRAKEALMLALFFNGKPEEAIRVGRDALALNPNDTELMGELGSRIAMKGDWKLGSQLVAQALARNPAESGYYHGVLALAAYMLNDYGTAKTEIEEANLKKFPFFHGVAAVIYGELGMTDKARSSAATFTSMLPQFIPNFQQEMDKRNISPPDRIHLLEGLGKAGVTLPPKA